MQAGFPPSLQFCFINQHFFFLKLGSSEMTSKTLLTLLVFVQLFSLTFLPNGYVKAQATTTLSVLPVENEIIHNTTKTITVFVNSGININAFDITILYDQSILSLVTWSHGDYLSNISNVLLSNTPGSLRAVATQLATLPVSGDGIFLNLEFRGNANGPSPITISNAALSGNGIKTYPTLQSGSILVHSY